MFSLSIAAWAPLAVLSGAQADETLSDISERVAMTPSKSEGKLVVCFASKGDLQNTPGSEAGWKALSGLLYKC
jgi:hypothetical protein